MKILFAHQNFPSQFKHLAPALARLGHEVVALTSRKIESAEWNGVKICFYPRPRRTVGVHPWAHDFATKVAQGEACLHAARRLQQEGFNPDAIIAHPAWGESLFLKEVWPDARLAVYCEYFFRAKGADADFDPEFAEGRDPCRLRMRNMHNFLELEAAEGGISPTRWQADTYPPLYRPKITVVHDGVDTRLVAPDTEATLTLRSGRTLSRDDELVTFVNRNLEPYRGYHIFMRALPMLLKARPKARVVIVGGDRVSYGASPNPERHGPGTWKQIFQREVSDRISRADWARVHFVGQLPYEDYVSLLKISSAHVYLTYPFVLSWSMIEAMSVGCAVVASDTAPVREVIAHGDTGLLVDFFDPAALAEAVCRVLDDPELRRRLGEGARAHVMAHYDLESVCLPGQLQWLASLGIK